MEAPSGSLWRFAISLYSRPEVAEVCLELQDRYGVDVNVVLFAAWMGAECGVELSEAEVAGIVAAVRPWSEEVVMPLRAVRRQLKSGPSPAPSAATEAARTKLKAVEIEMERIELTVLEELGQAQKGRAAMADADLITQNLTRIVAIYGGGEAASASSDLVTRIAQAASRSRLGRPQARDLKESRSLKR